MTHGFPTKHLAPIAAGLLATGLVAGPAVRTAGAAASHTRTHKPRHVVRHTSRARVIRVPRNVVKSKRVGDTLHIPAQVIHRGGRTLRIRAHTVHLPKPTRPPAPLLRRARGRALAPDDTQVGMCSILTTWDNTDGLGDIQALATDDGGVMNWVYAEVDTTTGGQELTHAISGPNWGLDVHSFVETPWVYVGSGQSVWIWYISAAAIPGYSQAGCSDAVGDGYWATA